MLRAAALLLLIGLLGAGYYYWKAAPGALPPRSLREAQQQLKDAALTGAVKTALALHKSLEPYALSATTEDTVVTLRGELPSAELKDAALRTAAAVPDVRQVVDHLKVDPALTPPAPKSDGRTLGERLDDETLAARVRMAFALHRSLKDAPVKVDSYKKELRLTGSVASAEARQLALQIANDVAGVRGVREELQLTSARPDAPDETRRAAAEQAIRANSNLDGAHIRVQLDGGVVVLQGHVRNGAERDLAALLARGAAGDVRNALEIRR
jgi:hyperosmotically inducible protein